MSDRYIWSRSVGLDDHRVMVKITLDAAAVAILDLSPHAVTEAFFLSLAKDGPQMGYLPFDQFQERLAKVASS